MFTVFINWSYDIPFLYIKSTADTTPVDIITVLSFNLNAIYCPSYLTCFNLFYLFIPFYFI